MRPRRWPYALLVLLVAAGVYLGIAAGAARATASAADRVRDLTTMGAFADAIQLDDAIADRTGPMYIFDSGDVSAASLDAERVMLAWAEALDRQGRFDQALAVVDEVRSPSLRDEAETERGQILIDAARTDAAHADYAGAIARLDQLQAAATTASVAAEAAVLLPQYQVAEAESLVAAGDGADAVAALDEVAQEGSRQAAIAAGAYPMALLSAGEQELSVDSYVEAAATLQRLVSQYPGTAQAAQARTMLAAPQPVTGTLVTRGGDPVSGEVRLSRNFSSQPGGYYTTSGPFYYSSADSTGTFRFDAVPVGGPYVLEVFRGDDWTTYVDPTTGQPATPVKVAPVLPVDLGFVELA